MVIRLPCVAFLSTLAVAGAACTPGTATDDAAVDAYPDRDACPTWATCNPVAQTGCLPNEKCTLYPTSPGWCPPPPTICFPDGEVALDGFCHIEPETLADDCAKPGFCQVAAGNELGLCREICNLVPDSCTTGHCVPVEWSATIGVGLCQPRMLPPG